MTRHTTTEVEAGELGVLILDWDMGGLWWEEPDPSVGHGGGWGGTPRLMGGQIGMLTLGPEEALRLMWDLVPADVPDAARREALLARLAERAVVEWAEGVGGRRADAAWEDAA